MKTLALLLLVACGGSPAKPTTPTTPTTPTAKPVAQPGTTALASELTGVVKKIRVEGFTNKTSLETALAPAIGKPITSDEMRVGLVDAAHVAGVADLTVHGVQLADGIEVVLLVTPQPTMTKISVIEAGGKVVPVGIGGLTAGGPLDPQRVQAYAQTLREKYVSNGYYNAEVAWKPTAGTGGVEVAVEVTPGAMSAIDGIAFTGNTLPKAELEKAIAGWLVVGQPVIADRITSASTVLSAYYWDKGYANVKIVDPQVTAGKITLTFKITEGPKFKIGSVDIKGVPDADKATYLKLFGVKSGDLFTRTGIVTGRDKILEKLKPGANVLPLTKIDIASKTINLTLEITGA